MLAPLFDVPRSHVEVNGDDHNVLGLRVTSICAAEFMPKRVNLAIPCNSLKSNRIALLKKKANWAREVTILHVLTKCVHRIVLSPLIKTLT